jgi:hypothetical protein
MSSVGVAYLDNGPATAAGSSAAGQGSSLNYSRNVADAAGQQASDNRIVRSLSSQQQSHQMPRT